MKFKEALEELDRKRQAIDASSLLEKEVSTDNFNEAIKVVFKGIDILLYFRVLFVISKISSYIGSYFIRKYLPENIGIISSCILGCFFGLMYIIFYKKIRNILGLKILSKYSPL